MQRLRELPIRLSMWIQRDRFDAHPFDELWSTCPMCGRRFDGHLVAPLGVAAPPWDSFVSAVENRDWERVVDTGHPEEFLALEDVAMAFCFQCPIEERMAVVVFRTPYPISSPPTLLSQQVLSEALSNSLLMRAQPKWRPAIRDRLESIREMRSRMRPAR